MHSHTANLLLSLFWLAEEVTKETLAAYRDPSGDSVDRRRLAYLANRGYVSRKKAPSGDWVFRLTDKGKLAATGGRIPPAAWTRPWDGNWHFILFDIPKSEEKTRKRLHRWLGQQHFGLLQDSVWVTPHPLKEAAQRIDKFVTRPRSVLVIDGDLSTTASMGTRELVEAAWNFTEINRRYREYMKSFEKANHSRKSHAWVEKENRAWKHAIERDPLLPAQLLPPGYLGRKAWSCRRKLLRMKD